MIELIIKENAVIENLIYEIRGKQVMLDNEIFITKYHSLITKKGVINNE